MSSQDTSYRLKAAPIVLKQDGSEGEVRAVFATYNVKDRDGDVIVPGAIPEKKVFLSAAHDWGLKGWIGDGTIVSTEDEAIFEGRFWTQTADGRDAYEKVKAAGDLAEWSWGFQVLEGDWGKAEGEDAFYIRKTDVFEVSPVLAGAGVNTRTVTLKAATPPPSVSQQEPSEASKRLAALGWDVLFPRLKAGAKGIKASERLQQIHDLAVANGASCATSEEEQVG